MDRKCIYFSSIDASSPFHRLIASTYNCDFIAVSLQIISRYDVLLLQEIRDRRATAVDVLLSRLNRYGKSLTKRVTSNKHSTVL